MDIEAMTNADLMALAKKVEAERLRRMGADPNPMAAYDRRERSLPDQIAALEKRIAALESADAREAWSKVR